MVVLKISKTMEFFVSFVGFVCSIGFLYFRRCFFLFPYYIKVAFLCGAWLCGCCFCAILYTVGIGGLLYAERGR